jgi:glycosyltransferase involved in cell wall biosynthesis
MNPTPDVAVAVATRNRSALLAELLDSLRAQTLDGESFEVIVVNDGSTDDTAELLERERAEGGLDLTVIKRDGGGPAAGRNAAWRAARAPLVAFTDDDCVADPGWLEAGVRAARAHPETIVQGRTEPRPDQLHRRSPFSRTQDIHGAGPLFETCNIFYPRSLLQSLEGFAEDVFKLPAGEDTDLAWRALERGCSTEYEPSALVHHAVLVDGAFGTLRYALRWHAGIAVYARHPGLRTAHLTHRIFWSRTHEQLLLFALGLVIGRRSRLLGGLLCRPYLLRLVRRRTGPLLAPYLLLLDLLEMGSVVVGAIRNRVLVI